MTSTKSTTISILTTVYNREKYLAECIESVQNGHFQDYEHIIVDDGSTDGSVALAQDYAAKDARIRVYQNETNLGDYPNRNPLTILFWIRYNWQTQREVYLAGQEFQRAYLNGKEEMIESYDSLGEKSPMASHVEKQ